MFLHYSQAAVVRKFSTAEKNLFRKIPQIKERPYLLDLSPKIGFIECDQMENMILKRLIGAFFRRDLAEQVMHPKSTAGFVTLYLEGEEQKIRTNHRTFGKVPAGKYYLLPTAGAPILRSGRSKNATLYYNGGPFGLLPFSQYFDRIDFLSRVSLSLSKTKECYDKPKEMNRYKLIYRKMIEANGIEAVEKECNRLGRHIQIHHGSMPYHSQGCILLIGYFYRLPSTKRTTCFVPFNTGSPTEVKSYNYLWYSKLEELSERVYACPNSQFYGQALLANTLTLSWIAKNTQLYGNARLVPLIAEIEKSENLKELGRLTQVISGSVESYRFSRLSTLEVSYDSKD